jgi:hypothetical protein
VTATPTPSQTDDPRLAVCSAPKQPGFAPHIIRPGDRLSDLMAGRPSGLTATQIAALNCLDNPEALPVGGVIWLPQANPPAPAAVGNGPARIIKLTGSAPVINNLDGITVSWEASGSAVYFYNCNPNPQNACIRSGLESPVPPVATRIINGFPYAGGVRYRLEAVNPDGSSVTRDVVFDVNCSYYPMVPARGVQPCPPEPPLRVQASWQPFQLGAMFWFADTKEIWVLTDADHRVRIYPDTWKPGMPDPTDKPPSKGLSAPIRGFGIVWKTYKGPDIGWATFPETGYDASRQRAGSVSYTSYIHGPGSIVYAVTRVPGQVTGYWARVAG